jgi:lysophospholipase L1-like esterase
VTRARRRLGSALLLLFGLGAGLALAEAVARRLAPDRYLVYPPGLSETFQPQPELIPGVFGPSRFTINELGMRGDSLGQQRYRILAVGGSTTICIYLDDSEAWPHRVQDLLNAALGPDSVWIGNVGRSGHASGQNALHVEKLLPQHPEIDGLIVLAGGNDLLIQLAYAIDPETLRHQIRNADASTLLESAFSAFPAPADAPWWRRSGLAQLWASARIAFWAAGQSGARLDTTGIRLSEWRSARKQASVLRETLPDLSNALAIYESNLARILDLAAAAGVHVTLLTQPSLWSEDLTQASRDLLWTGGPTLDQVGPGKEYFSVGALAQGMRLYNERMLRLCRWRDADCLDLASQVPRTQEFFWDDVHFTEAGSRLVAERVARHLLERRELLTRLR